MNREWYEIEVDEDGKTTLITLQDIEN